MCFRLCQSILTQSAKNFFYLIGISQITVTLEFNKFIQLDELFRVSIKKVKSLYNPETNVNEC